MQFLARREALCAALRLRPEGVGPPALKWSGHSGRVQYVTTESPPEALDYEALLDELGGDRQLRRQLLELLIESTTQSSASIRMAYAARDSSALASSAHKLKSALVAFGAQPAADAASRLEDIGRCADLATASTALDLLQDELTRLQSAVASLLKREDVPR